MPLKFILLIIKMSFAKKKIGQRRKSGNNSNKKNKQYNRTLSTPSSKRSYVRTNINRGRKYHSKTKNEDIEKENSHNMYVKNSFHDNRSQCAARVKKNVNVIS